MPTGIKVAEDLTEKRLSPADLVPGEMYRDHGGDWALALKHEEGHLVAAVFDMTSDNRRWFKFLYPYGTTYYFTGPYEAVVHIGRLKVTDPGGGSRPGS